MSRQKKIHIPAALIWAQCIIFAGLYGIWAIYELLYFRRILLISGAVLALYPIYQYRKYFFQKRAAPLWLMFALFAWMLFHLLFLSHDYPAQLMELKRIWKYAGLGAVFALGLGLSLTNASNSVALNSGQRAPYWPIVYFGLCLPVLIYLLKYALTIYGSMLGITTPDFLRINSNPSSAYYIPKTDYIAFCLPVFALSLGQIYTLLISQARFRISQYFEVLIYLLVIGSTLLLFNVQNTKNGIAYAALCIGLFLVLLLFKASTVELRYKILFLGVVVLGAIAVIYPHLQKNDSWGTLIADTRVGFQLEKYPNWKDPAAYGYPNNEFGKTVSITNYERAAWFKAGIELVAIDPLGYGLVEDSFGKMAKARWPDASQNLTHSHSGWLDLLLGLGVPGFFCILAAIIISIRQSKQAIQPWQSLVFWALFASSILWVTTEVAATISFCALIFWISWSCGLTLVSQNPQKISKKS